MFCHRSLSDRRTRFVLLDARVIFRFFLVLVLVPRIACLFLLVSEIFIFSSFIGFFFSIFRHLMIFLNAGISLKEWMPHGFLNQAQLTRF